MKRQRLEHAPPFLKRHLPQRRTRLPPAELKRGRQISTARIYRGHCLAMDGVE